MLEPAISVRARNMGKRRVRILDAARALLAEGGAEAINLRALALAARVSVPTIYNLVGNKEELIAALFSEVLAEIETRVGLHANDDPLAQATAVVTESTAVFARDENYYRSAFIAVEYLDQSGAYRATVARLYRWGEQLVVDGCRACREAGLLRGRIPQQVFGAQILRSYRSSCRAWAFGQTTIEQFRNHALIDIYTSLAADAVETFREVLIRKVDTLASAAVAETPDAKRPSTRIEG